jgi:hypothetical protein
MTRAFDLMDQESDIIVTVDITFAAISMVGIFLLVFDHRRLGIKVPVALFVGTLDLHCDRCRADPAQV